MLISKEIKFLLNVNRQHNYRVLFRKYNILLNNLTKVKFELSAGDITPVIAEATKVFSYIIENYQKRTKILKLCLNMKINEDSEKNSSGTKEEQENTQRI